MQIGPRDGLSSAQTVRCDVPSLVSRCLDPPVFLPHPWECSTAILRERARYRSGRGCLNEVKITTHFALLLSPENFEAR